MASRLLPPAGVGSLPPARKRGGGEQTAVSPLQPEVKASISLFMSHVHTTVNEMSKLYLATERRYNYTTPKTFLEQIKLYQNLLARKRMELGAKITRLENGLMKLQSTASQVGKAGSRTFPHVRETGLPPWRNFHSQTTENVWVLLEKMGSTCFGNADVIVSCFTWGPKSGGICALGECVHDHVAVPRRLACCGAQVERLLPSSFLPGFKSPPYWSPDPITLTAHSWCPQGSPENSPHFPAELWPHTAGVALPLPPRIPSPLNRSQASLPPPQAVWQGSRPPL